MVDRLLARYGWTLEYLYGLRPEVYYRLSQAALKAETEVAREQLTVEAFGAWLAGYAGRKTFGQFLQHLGLEDTQTKPRTSKEEALALAKSIVERDRVRAVQNSRPNSP